MHNPNNKLASARILGFAGFAALALVWHLVHRFFGQTEGFRIWGIGLLVVSVVFTIRKEISLSIGHRELSPLTGLNKGLVLLPTYAIGTLVTLYPHQVACTVNLKGYVCV